MGYTVSAYTPAGELINIECATAEARDRAEAHLERLGYIVVDGWNF